MPDAKAGSIVFRNRSVEDHILEFRAINAVPEKPQIVYPPLVLVVYGQDGKPEAEFDISLNSRNDAAADAGFYAHQFTVTSERRDPRNLDNIKEFKSGESSGGT